MHGPHRGYRGGMRFAILLTVAALLGACSSGPDLPRFLRGEGASSEDTAAAASKYRAALTHEKRDMASLLPVLA